ncbi:MAG: dihydrofolate reductase [Acetobacter sp.]|nr:dihydrofolate reductase [Acetobacter sp.]
MTVVAMWCRHKGDNLIGIGSHIPWQISSDTERFLAVVKEQTVVCGRKTYESLPNRTIDGSKMYVMTSKTDYEVWDEVHHRVISSQKALAELEEDIYIAGGAEVYYLFMTGKEKLKPQVVVDCVYEGDVAAFSGERIDITDSVAVMEKGYRRVSPYYVLDGVNAAIWLRKGEFVEQSVLKRIVAVLEKNAKIVW